LRLERGISQRDLSGPGITYAYISRIEAGTRQPSVKALRMLARKLLVTPEYLETGSDLQRVQLRELRLAELELRLRLDGESDLAETRAILQEAEAEADTVAVVRARIQLGFAASAAGDYGGTIAELTRVVESELVSPASRPDVYATLGYALAAAGYGERAVRLFEGALAELALLEPDNRAGEVRYTTYLSYALTDLGELDRARSVLAEIWSRTDPSDDRYTRIRLYWSLGRVALEADKPLAALDNFRRAIALLEATEDATHLARAHLASAEAALGSDDADAAQAHLASAERLLARPPGRADLACVRRTQALLSLHAGAPGEAVVLSGEALALSQDFPREHARAWFVAAQARAELGQTGAADEAFAEAVRLLAQHGSSREHAEALRSYGRYLRTHAREREALDVFEQAAEVAVAIHDSPAGQFR
jgi:tetratricopeptide (TPR) repeat protein